MLELNYNHAHQLNRYNQAFYSRCVTDSQKAYSALTSEKAFTYYRLIAFVTVMSVLAVGKTISYAYSQERKFARSFNPEVFEVMDAIIATSSKFLATIPRGIAQTVQSVTIKSPEAQVEELATFCPLTCEVPFTVVSGTAPNYSIRQLKKLASQTGVKNYGRMTKDQLYAAIFK